MGSWNVPVKKVKKLATARAPTRIEELHSSGRDGRERSFPGSVIAVALSAVKVYDGVNRSHAEYEGRLTCQSRKADAAS